MKHPDDDRTAELPGITIRELWSVELELPGNPKRHTWTGHAINSIDATEQAKREFLGARVTDSQPIGPRPLRLRVRSCMQVGV